MQRYVATAVRGMAGGQGHADVAVTCLVPRDDGHLAPSAPKPAARGGASGVLTQSLRLVAAAAQGAPLMPQPSLRVAPVCSSAQVQYTIIQPIVVLLGVPPPPSTEAAESGCACTAGIAAPAHPGPDPCKSCAAAPGSTACQWAGGCAGLVLGSRRPPAPPLQMRCALMGLCLPVDLLAAQVLQLPLSPIPASGAAE